MSFILLGILNSQVTGAAGGSYELISSTVLSSATRTVSFTSIPSDYKHLQLRMSLRSNDANALNLIVRINNDSGSNYARHYLRGTGSSVQSGGSSSQTEINFGFTNVDRSDFAANAFAPNILDILDYSNSSKNSTLRLLGGSTQQVGLASGLWQSTAAITSISLYHGSFEDWAAKSRFSLYGIRG